MMKPRISLFAEHEREDRRTKLGDPLVGLAKLIEDFEDVRASVAQVAMVLNNPSETAAMQGGLRPRLAGGVVSCAHHQRGRHHGEHRNAERERKGDEFMIGRGDDRGQQ